MFAQFAPCGMSWCFKPQLGNTLLTHTKRYATSLLCIRRDLFLKIALGFGGSVDHIAQIVSIKNNRQAAAINDEWEHSLTTVTTCQQAGTTTVGSGESLVVGHCDDFAEPHILLYAITATFELTTCRSDASTLERKFPKNGTL